MCKKLPVFRDDHIKADIQSGKISILTVTNDNTPRNLIILTALKNIFQKQLPKMPKEYITRLIYDRHHHSIAIIRRKQEDFNPSGSKTCDHDNQESKETENEGNDAKIIKIKSEFSKETENKITTENDENEINSNINIENSLPTDPHKVCSTLSIIGGCTFRLFPNQGFCEIVFCAISASEQVKGFGSILMSWLKEQVKESSQDRIKHLLTYADNYAVGYFRKQGFSKFIGLDRSIWSGWIKDYDGGTLMHCELIPGIDYKQLYKTLWEQKVRIVKEIDQRTGCGHVYPGLFNSNSNSFSSITTTTTTTTMKMPTNFPIDPMTIPGVASSGWTPQLQAKQQITRRGKLYELLRPLLNDLQSHPASWPFLKPVDPEEVPSYQDIIKHPMDLETIDKKLEQDSFHQFEEFASDIHLITSNCRTFNDPDTTYYKNANILEKYFIEKSSRMKLMQK